MLAGGTGGRLNVVIDGFEKIRGPIYDGLTVPVNAPKAARWYSFDVAPWAGRRAYLEACDGASADFGGSTTALVDGRGRLEILAVRATDDPKPSEAPAEPVSVDVESLVRDLNASTRFVILSMGGPGNASGAGAVLTWQTGFSSSVNLARGVPRSVPGATSAESLLASGGADAALIVADIDPVGLSQAARDHLARIPRIVIAPNATAPEVSATVALDTATSGIDAGGTVMRSDGVVLPLRPPLAPRVATDHTLLKSLGDRLEAPC